MQSNYHIQTEKGTNERTKLFSISPRTFYSSCFVCLYVFKRRRPRVVQQKPSEIYRVARSPRLSCKSAIARTFISREEIRVIVRGQVKWKSHISRDETSSVFTRRLLIFHDYDFQRLAVDERFYRWISRGRSRTQMGGIIFNSKEKLPKLVQVVQMNPIYGSLFNLSLVKLRVLLWLTLGLPKWPKWFYNMEILYIYD